MPVRVKETPMLISAEMKAALTEQVEEVSSMETLLRMVQRAGESGLLFVESYLAQGLAAAGEGAAE